MAILPRGPTTPALNGKQNETKRNNQTKPNRTEQNKTKQNVAGPCARTTWGASVPNVRHNRGGGRKKRTETADLVSLTIRLRSSRFAGRAT